MNRSLTVWLICLSIAATVAACNQQNKEKKDAVNASRLPESDNEDVAKYMPFSGVGALMG